MYANSSQAAKMSFIISFIPKIRNDFLQFGKAS